MSYTKEQQAENRAKWVAALRSGEYSQTKGMLTDGAGYCCLGVACELAFRAGVVGRGHEVYFDSFGTFNAVLPPSVRQWLGLALEDGELTGYEDGSDRLTDLNDGAEYTFEQIADVIESGKVRLAE